MKCVPYKIFCLLLLATFFGSAENIFATRCNRMNVCERYAAYDLIFVAKYKNIFSAVETEGRNLLEKYPNRFEVSEMFLGSEDDVKKVIYNSVGLSNRGLADGETYLIYANKKDQNTFVTGICSTKLMNYADEDLSFLRNIPKQISETSTLSGLIETSRDVDIKGIKIKVEKVDNDLQTFEISPDVQGNFELQNLAKGQYTFTPLYLGQTIRNLYSTSNRAFEIRGRGCYKIEPFIGKDEKGVFNFN